MSIDPRVRAVASHALGLEALRRCAHALRPLGIYAMPLKGIWLQSYVYESPADRLTSDVDLIVPETAFRRARRALTAAGFEARNGNASEVALYAPDLPMPIDLHARLFMPGAFALSTRALFARASPPVELAGAPVVLPDPLDGLCHLVGHLVKSRSRPDDEKHTRDFAAVARRFSLSPDRIARRLVNTGMARAARYAFGHLALREPTFAEVITALPSDRAGELLARACARVRMGEGHAQSSLIGRAAGALPGFLLERSLPAAGRALLLRAVSLPADRPHT